jgi:hypothetical protein
MDVYDGRPSLRLLLSTLSLSVILALAGGWSAPPAKADGDPASDVLATQQLFLPQDAALPPAQQSQLVGLVQEASHAGYPIRVALIASATDLGSITELWRQPQKYAQFLGLELSLVYHGPLLVVMPNGFGLYGFPRPPAAERSALAGANPAGGLDTATVTAIRSLATAAGHPLSVPAAATTIPVGGGNAVPWIAFAVGALLIALAWTASLRARAPSLPGRKSTAA